MGEGGGGLVGDGMWSCGFIMKTWLEYIFLFFFLSNATCTCVPRFLLNKAGEGSFISRMYEWFGNGFLVESFPDDSFCSFCFCFFFSFALFSISNQTGAPLFRRLGTPEEELCRRKNKLYWGQLGRDGRDL